MADDFDPNEHTAEEVKAELADATDEVKTQIAAAEKQGKARKSVLEAAGVDPSVRTDASGRVLNGWETAPPKPGELEN